jgi:hypothetical protein
MSDTWVIVKWPERVFGQSESGFDSSSPRTGIVVWEPDKTREKVTLSSGLRKCFPYSLEHFRYAQAEGFIKALLGELDYILLYWLISREFAKSLDSEVPEKSVKSGAKYNVTKDFHSVLEGLGVDSAHFPDSKKILGRLEHLKSNGSLLDDDHVKGAFRYNGEKTLEDMWGDNPKVKAGNYTSEFLRANLSVLFHGNSQDLEQRDFSQVLKAAKESNCPVILQYAAQIWCGYDSQGAVESFLNEQPLKFINEFSFLIQEISGKAPKNDSFKRGIASNLILPLVSNTVRHPISSAFSVPKSELLDDMLNELKLKKFSAERRLHLSRINADQAQHIIESLIPESDAAFSLDPERNSRPAEAVETLLAINAVHVNTGHAPQLTKFRSNQIIDLYSELASKESEILRVGGAIFALRKSFESALTNIIANATDSDDDILEKIRSSFEPEGCIPGTFANEVFLALCNRNPKESARPGWWIPLSLSQIVSNCREHSHLTKDVASLWVQSKHFSNELARHVRDSRNTSDLAVLLEADHLFNIISASDISQAWARVASRLAFLEAVTDDIADSRVADLRNSMSKEHEKALAKNRGRELELEAKVKELMENISSMDSAMQRGAETLGAAKLGHELGVSKKFCEALAKMIRRMEREFGATAFKEILNKESAGLSRLGVTLMVASESAQFDPASHDPAGRTINLGSNVEILETGVLLSVGKDTITILRAVVNPAD